MRQAGKEEHRKTARFETGEVTSECEGKDVVGECGFEGVAAGSEGDEEEMVDVVA
jgi:hypothetical protein